MSTKAEPLENMSLSSWLAELRMECYKKNLENFDTIKPLLDVKESELKKLGISNSKDRAVMLGSLANYRAIRDNGGISTPHDSSSKFLRKSSLKKLNLKSLLGSSSKKNKKKTEKTENVMTEAPSMSAVIDLTTPFSPTSPTEKAIFEYQEAHEGSSKPFQGIVCKAVENEYVPSPQSSPRSDAHRLRAYTFADFHSTPHEVTLADVRRDLIAEEDSPSSLMRHKHLSVISMESGLSFGYDFEKDFNPSLPLENQPWFHGKISRAEAESILHEDGEFLVRENVTMSDTFTLSMYWRGKCDHTLINTTEVVSSRGKFRGSSVKYQLDGGAFDSLPELIYNHVKYQIPIDKRSQNVVTNPVCRPKGFGGYAHEHAAENFAMFSTLPKNFGSKHKKRSASPDPIRQAPLHPVKLVSFSPNKESSSPQRERSQLKVSTSSGDLLESSEFEEIEVHRNVISPPPEVEFRSRATAQPSPWHNHGRVRTRAATTANKASLRGRLDSSEDYEIMESVSILNLSIDPSQTYAQLTPKTAPPPSSSSSSSSSPKDVKYAEIRYPKREPSRRNSVARDPSNPVKYAEIKFPRLKVSSSAIPHPFSIYSQLPPPTKLTNPYQSRAELLAQKLQADPNYAIPKPQQGGKDSNYARLSRYDSSPHPFSQYATVQTFPRQTSTPSMASLTNSNRTSGVPIAQTNTTLYTLPDKNRKSRTNRESTLSSESAHSSHSGHASPGLAHNTKVLKGLPGYEALVKLQALLAGHTNDELAYHVTKADAVCFLLTPRPGEDDDIWKERVQQVTSSSGLYVGLQTLADLDGERLWKKLYFRHLSLSQMVSLCVVSAGETLDRAKMLKRLIELASLLQSGSYGNLFSFVAIMQGLAAPQVTSMAKVWEILHTHFPEAGNTYKELQGLLSTLSEGVSVYATDQLTVPAIQHLKAVFHYEEQPMPGHAHTLEDRSLLGEYSRLLTGLDSVHTIVGHCSHFCYNARRKLGALQYDATLMDFFMQDYTRTYLQHIGVNDDETLERRRRFGVLLDALTDRVESIESSTT